MVLNRVTENLRLQTLWFEAAGTIQYNNWQGGMQQISDSPYLTAYIVWVSWHCECVQPFWIPYTKGTCQQC